MKKLKFSFVISAAITLAFYFASIIHYSFADNYSVGTILFTMLTGLLGLIYSLSKFRNLIWQCTKKFTRIYLLFGFFVLQCILALSVYHCALVQENSWDLTMMILALTLTGGVMYCLTHTVKK